MRRTYLLATATVLVTAAVSSVPAPALAKGASQDCYANGGSSLRGHYTIAELTHALDTMPATIQEYSNCYSVIQGQILKQQRAAHPHRHGGGPGSNSNTPGSGHHRGSDPKAHAAADSSSGSSTVLIVVIVVVAIAGMILAFLASRRRRGGSPPTDGPPPSS